MTSSGEEITLPPMQGGITMLKHLRIDEVYHIIRLADEAAASLRKLKVRIVTNSGLPRFFSEGWDRGCGLDL